MDPEFLKALELVAEFDRNRPTTLKEFRLYYNEDGTIIGLWETDHPGGNYIVLDDLTQFNTTNTSLLRVKDNKLTVVDAKIVLQNRLIKSTAGQQVATGNAAIALYPSEEYSNVEYYDRKTNN
jgi:hypothetical protein